MKGRIPGYVYAQMEKRRDGYTAIMSETPQPCVQLCKKTSHVVLLQAPEKKRPAARPTQPATEPQETPATQITQPSPGVLSIDGMIAGLPDDLILEEVDPLEGQPRHFGATGSGQVVLEFWGPETDLLRSEIMVTVLDISDADLNRNADLVRLFIQNAVPQWQRDTVWVANFLRELSSQDIGTGGFDTRSKTVRFRFIKPLSAIRVTIEKAS